ncbi:MAG: ATP-binding protein [Solirubrobacterales bacterium]|nr:ATP-binding protein [Solirubrobacterales bacterium]
MSDDSPIISLRLESSPETLTLVRGMLGGVAELLQLDPELLDDLKTAVSEACNNVVMHAYEGASGPLCICIFTEDDGLVVIVRDRGRGIPVLAPSDDRLQGVGIPIMRALAQQTSFRPYEGGGTEVWLKFASERDGRPLYTVPDAASPEDGWSDQLDGDAIVSLSPVSFVGGVLGRLARAMAARARFSLDRFSDVYLVTDAVAAHAARAASEARLGFGLTTDTRRLEMVIGPLRPGASSGLTTGAADDVGSALRLLSDELDVRRTDGSEILRIVMLDQRARATP